MGWPDGGSTEHAAARTVGRVAPELVIDRGHRILRNTPGVVRLHGDRRWNDERCRLAGSMPVVIAVPRALVGLRASPVITPGGVPDPTCVGTESVGVRTAGGQSAVVEHVALDRPADGMDARSDVSDCPVDVRASPVDMRASSRWAIVARYRSRLSLGIVPSKTRRKSDACKRNFPNHEGFTPVRNSVRKKVVSVEAQLGDFREARLNKLFSRPGIRPWCDPWIEALLSGVATESICRTSALRCAPVERCSSHAFGSNLDHRRSTSGSGRGVDKGIGEGRTAGRCSRCVLRFLGHRSGRCTSQRSLGSRCLG